MNDPLVELRDIEFTYPGREPLLRGVSLAVGAGERVGLTGANGAGKTTLLHIAMGLLAPRGGAIIVAGKRCATERDFLRARRSMGLLFQNSEDQLVCATVEEDLAFGPFNLGLPREEVVARVRETLDRLGIAPLARRLVHRLSDGEKRLVALGTLLTMRPRLLLLDEPTSGLDDAARARLLGIISNLPSALLIATHDRALLDALAARRLHLRDGLLTE